MGSYNETITEVWDYWNYYKRVIRNKNTGVETLISSGKYIHATAGLLRVGKRITNMSSTEELIEYTAVALKPNIRRMSNYDFPISLSLSVYISSIALNSDQSSLEMKARAWANLTGVSWTSDSEISYSDIVGYYIPFDLTSSNYTPSTYEISVSLNSGDYLALFEDFEYTFYKFMRNRSIGFMLTATGGRADIYGPAYSTTTLRPQFDATQTVSGRLRVNVTLDTELVALSKVKGVCRDRNGTIITGSQCRIVIYHKSNYNILGTGLSDFATGAFLVETSCKVGELVVASFLNSNNVISGSELMTTVSYLTI